MGVDPAVTRFDGGEVEWWPLRYLLLKRLGIRGTGVAVHAGKVRFDDQAFVVTATVELAEEDAFVSSITFDRKEHGPRLTGAALRENHPGECIANAMRALTVAVGSDENGAPVRLDEPGDPARPLDRADVDESQRSGREASARTALLKQVAEVYRQAMTDGRSTGKAVWQIDGVPSHDQARQRIREARRLGLLPPTQGSTRPKL